MIFLKLETGPPKSILNYGLSAPSLSSFLHSPPVTQLSFPFHYNLAGRSGARTINNFWVSLVKAPVNEISSFQIYCMDTISSTSLTKQGKQACFHSKEWVLLTAGDLASFWSTTTRLLICESRAIMPKLCFLFSFLVKMFVFPTWSCRRPVPSLGEESESPPCRQGRLLLLTILGVIMKLSLMPISFPSPAWTFSRGGVTSKTIWSNFVKQAVQPRVMFSRKSIYKALYGME